MIAKDEINKAVWICTVLYIQARPEVLFELHTFHDWSKCLKVSGNMVGVKVWEAGRCQ